MIWLDILLVVVAVTLLKGAIMGAWYSSGRGSNHPLFATVKSVPARIAIGFVALGILAWAIRDYRHKI
ncbi:MAG: hypothetical protein DMG49_15030 [Acidobacteria bacterium]|nr:MAG: hypothetical protein DMG49_15030 [Acidobacteriota bacterium]